MPFYDYRCDQCDEGFTAYRSVTARDEIIACPACKDQRVSRLLSSVMVRTLGSNSPNSPAEKLAGKGIKSSNAKGATSVLGHACHSGCGCG